MKRESIARIAHEVNRAYCASQGDMSTTEWSKATEAQRASMLAGVDMHLDNPGSSPQAQHEAWMAAKAADGWTHGDVKDEAAKTHPAFLPYDQLPAAQRAKDFIFKMIVTQLKDVPDVAAKAPPAQSIDRISVKYIGHGGNRPTHRDALYGTGLVWDYGQSLLVPTKIAAVMLAKHPEVYAPGDATDEAPPIEDKAGDEAQEFQRLQEARDAINAMTTKAAVAAYAKTHYQRELTSTKLGEMRAEASQLIDQYGAP